MGADSKTIIQLRHVTAFEALQEVIGLTTMDGRKYFLACEHVSTWQRFREQLSALLDRQSAAAGLGGAGTELEKLADLVNRGMLAAEDFDRAKGLMLGKPPSRVHEQCQLLESLFVLHKQGVLSESEFNMKKWDILSRTGGKP